MRSVRRLFSRRAQVPFSQRRNACALASRKAPGRIAAHRSLRVRSARTARSQPWPHRFRPGNLRDTRPISSIAPSGAALRSRPGTVTRSCAQSSSALSGWSNMRRASPPRNRSRNGQYPARLCALDFETTNQCCWRPIGLSLRRRVKDDRSRRPPNGCSTITMSWKSKSARSARTSRRASIDGCPSSAMARLTAIHACSEWPGHSLPTPTADLIPKRCVVLSAPINAFSH